MMITSMELRSEATPLAKLLVTLCAADNESAARRMIAAGDVRINGEPETDTESTVPAGNYDVNVTHAGKRSIVSMDRVVMWPGAIQ